MNKIISFFLFTLFTAIIIVLIIACKKVASGGEGTGNTPPTPPPTPPPVGGVITTPPEIKPLPMLFQAEYEAGNVTPGDHTQHMLDLSYSESDPDRIYMGQDVSNIWVSRDFGLNWFTLKNEGLYSSFVITVEADPLNKNRVLAAVQCRPYVGVDEGNQGIYQSLDGGITWQKRMSRTRLGEIRSSTKLITYAPTSKNTTLGYATRWYAAFSEYKNTINGDELVADDGLIYSNDGGQSWKEARKLPSVTYGSKVRGVKVHNTNQDKVFIYGNGGMFRFEDATNPSGTVTKLSGSNGLPEGDIWGQLYQSDDGNTLIVAVSKKGIYKSVDGGDTWDLLYGWADVNYCYINKSFPNKIFAVPVQSSGQQIKISDDGGNTWFSPAKSDVTYRLGYDNSDWNKLLNGQFTYILPDPRNADKVFIHTKSKNFRSIDGGKNWTVSDNGFNGTSHDGSVQMFDPSNSDRFAYFMVDRAVAITTNRGRWFEIASSTAFAGSTTCIAGALEPGGSAILACVGSGSGGQLMRSPDNGKTWAVTSAGNKARLVIGFDLKDTKYCYQWKERSSDGGKTWVPLSNMPENSIICGISSSNGSVLYAIDNNGTGKKIWRSNDRGDNWGTDPVITTSWDLTTPGPTKTFTFCVDPSNPDIVYTSSADGQITRWDISVTPAKSKQITFPGGAEPNFYIKDFAIDAKHPNVMYAINQRANTGHKIFRSNDEGANWQNISDYIPQGSLKGISVSPVTGEVYLSSENGSLVMLPPYSTSNTAYEVVPYKMNHIMGPYD